MAITKPLLLIGCGGHARSLIELVESTSQWKICGLVGLPGEVGGRVLGYPIIGTDSDLPNLRSYCPSAVLAVGQLPAPASRKILAGLLNKYAFDLPVLISPHAVVSSSAKIGCGTTVGHGAVVNAAADVGAHCILNTCSLIEHDVKIRDYCHISTGALVNGGVHLGSGSFIGSGAIIREGLRLPAHTIISSGKRVMGWPLKDT